MLIHYTKQFACSPTNQSLKDEPARTCRSSLRSKTCSLFAQQQQKLYINRWVRHVSRVPASNSWRFFQRKSKQADRWFTTNELYMVRGLSNLMRKPEIIHQQHQLAPRPAVLLLRQRGRLFVRHTLALRGTWFHALTLAVVSNKVDNKRWDSRLLTLDSWLLTLERSSGR